MAKHVIDLTNYKDKVGTRITPGRYTVIVEDAESDKSRAGNAMVTLFFRVQGGNHDGATIVDRLVLTEKSLFRVVGFLQALGFPTPKKRIKIDTDTFVGRTLQIDVEDGEPYQNRGVKSEVRGHLRLDSEEDESEDLDDLAEAESEESDESEDEAEESPEPEPKKKAKKKSDDEDESETVDLDDLDLG